MKTTELFAEQVLIGFLVILIVGLVFLHSAQEFLTTYTKPLEQIGTGAFLVGSAYLIGMVYDRIADTLLEHLESHSRIHFALKEFKIKGCGIDRFSVPAKDPFEDGKYRIMVLGNVQATDHMEYLRSRIRLTRALVTLLPGIMVSVLLAMDHGKASRWWTMVAVTIPVVYAAALFLKVVKRKTLFKRPPKTFELKELEGYMCRARMLRENSKPPRHILWLLFQDEVWIALVLLVVAATALILSTRSYARFSIVLGGVVLTVIVGWSWWRISGTFFSFLRDYKRYGPAAAGVAWR